MYRLASSGRIKSPKVTISFASGDDRGGGFGATSKDLWVGRRVIRRKKEKIEFKTCIKT